MDHGVAAARPANAADRDAYEHLVATQGSFLQGRRWGEFREGAGWRAERLVAERDGVLVGVVQALWRRFRPAGSMLYVPRGPVALDEAARRALLAALGPLARRLGAWFVRVEPDLTDTPEHVSLLEGLGLRRAPVTVQLPHTVLVDLTPPLEEILAGFKPTWRRFVRHAPKRGVQVREGALGDLPAFYRLERETATRQGILGRPFDYYRRFFEQFGAAGAHLWLAELEGEPLAAILTLEYGATATYLYGASTRRHSEVHATYLLQWIAMQHARAAGCTCYDLWGTGAPGDSSCREAGLTAFKRGFGPVVSLAGAWDLPVSRWYPAWRRLESARKFVLQRSTRRRRGAEGTTATMPTRPPTLRDVTPAPAAQWDAWLAASPGGGHWLQTHAWGEFKRGRRWRPLRLLLEQDGEVVGAAQMLLYRLPLLGTLAYCPKGPWLDWSRPEQVDAFFGATRTLLRPYRAFALKIEPEALEADERLKAQLAGLGFRKFRWDPQFKTTMVVDLAPSEEQVLARMSQTARRYIRAAQREGVTVAEETSPEAMDAFYALFEVTSKRGGFFLRPRWYLKGVWTALIAAGYGRFLFARKDDKNLVAMFLTNFGGKVFYKDGSSVAEGQQAHATYALQWAAMRWGQAHEATYYDMVAIPPPDQLENREHEMWGLYEFKRKFGGDVRDFLGAYDQPYAKRTYLLWDRLIEPIYYRAYMKLTKNVYY